MIEYLVEHNGIADYSNRDLGYCLQHIGRAIKGTNFGCLLVTAKEAADNGYSIRQVDMKL